MKSEVVTRIEIALLAESLIHGSVKLTKTISFLAEFLNYREFKGPPPRRISGRNRAEWVAGIDRNTQLRFYSSDINMFFET